MGRPFMQILLLLCAATALGQVPPQDARNVEIPDTDTHFKPKAFWRHASHGTLDQWEERRRFLRGQILSAAGLDPMPEKTPLNPQIFGRLEREGYTIEKVLLETMPGYFLAGNLYRPLGKSGKFPGVLRAHGHWRNGRLENTLLCSVPGFGINMARQGYVVFAYDMVGWNDTVQTPHEFGGPLEQLWGFGPLGLQLWNSIRALDFLQSLPEVDPEQICMTGASGGGTQTFLLAAVDDRVKYSAPVNMVSAIMQGGSPCENAPNLRLNTYNVEITALMAPRPMILVSSPWDQSRNTPREEYIVIRGIYSLYGKAQNVETVEVDAQHNYNRESREAVYRFFGKHILRDTDVSHLSEKPFQVEMNEDMLVLHGRQLPKNALNYDGLFRQWRDSAMRQTAQTRDQAALRQRLAYALASEWPSRIVTEISGENIVIGRAGRKDRVPGQWHPGKGSPLLVIHEEGSAAARKTPHAQSALAAGRPLLLIDAFQTDTAAAPRDRSHRYFLTFNKSDDANRVQDILTALAFLNSQTSGRIELRGLGKAGIWCLFAAAVAGVETVLEADLDGFQGRDEDFLGQFFVPSIQRAGGLDTALRLTETLRRPSSTSSARQERADPTARDRPGSRGRQ
jgi:Acetyl xylan esterase (AXE1)